MPCGGSLPASCRGATDCVKRSQIRLSPPRKCGSNTCISGSDPACDRRRLGLGGGAESRVVRGDGGSSDGDLQWRFQAGCRQLIACSAAVSDSPRDSGAGSDGHWGSLPVRTLERCG